MNRRLAALEGRIRPAPGPEDDEKAREELDRQLDRLRARMIETGDLHEDDDGALCLPDGTRLAALRELDLSDLLQDHRGRRLAKSVARCAPDCVHALAPALWAFCRGLRLDEVRDGGGQES